MRDIELLYQRGHALFEDGDQEGAARAWHVAADEGLADAQYAYGTCCLQGNGVERNEDDGVVWLEKAAAQKLAAAMCALGMHYAAVPDEVTAASWYRKAAEVGDPSGQYELGMCYAHGIGVERDARQAAQWFEKAAEQGDPVAQTNLAMHLLARSGTAEDEREAARWLHQAAFQKFPAAMHFLGQLFARGSAAQSPDAAAAVFWLRQASLKGFEASKDTLDTFFECGQLFGGDDVAEAPPPLPSTGGLLEDFAPRETSSGLDSVRAEAEAGDPEARYRLGRAYALGLSGIEPNEVAAHHLLLRAAREGSVDAQFAMGLRYMRGIGTASDAAAGAALLRQAAETGHPLATFMYSECFALGTGVRKNEVEALGWMRKLAESGSAHAANRVAAAYAAPAKVAAGSQTGAADPTEVTQDPVAAVEWLERAAKGGDVTSWGRLALCLEHGFGTAVDETRAEREYMRAAFYGLPSAMRGLARLLAKQGNKEAAETWSERARLHEMG